MAVFLFGILGMGEGPLNWETRCTREKNQMRKLEKVAISHNFNFKGVVVFFVPLQEQFAENTNKSYHVCKVDSCSTYIS